MIIRDLHTIPEFRQVMALEQQIWGSDESGDTVGIPLFAVTVKRGGILLGAYDREQLAGFVYSFPGLKDGRPLQWSHMLGVRPEHRGTGLGRLLKLEQRQRALALGIDLMEWTFDPLQALNAHLNFQRLGVVAEEYHLDVYGESTSVLHRGNPTDRFIAQWRLRSPRVVRMVDASAGFEPGAPEAPSGVPVVLGASRSGAWLEPDRLVLGRSDPEVLVTIPEGFTDMLEREPGLARAWRVATREVFTHYVGRGYKAVSFARDPGTGGGHYRLSTALPADLEA